jgi:hypothetical protein
MLNNPLQLIGMLQNAQNPMALMQQVLGTNPQFKQVMQIAQGKSPQELEQYVRNLYQSQGKDINQTASQFGLKI